jgi:ribosome-binding protein aMBF1 (putative translation factor)
MLYRLYLLKRGRIRASEIFYAQNDNEAKEIASRVCNACDDSFKQYELWSGTEQITSVRRVAQTVPQRERKSQDIALAHQEIVLDLEDRLQKSFTSLAASRKLLAASAELRSRVYPYTDDQARSYNHKIRLPQP